jgi:hypothetical protein
VPVPPLALAVHVADPPVVIEAGETVHDEASAGVTVIVVSAEEEPPEPVQVSVYVVVFAGDTETVPLVGDTLPTPEIEAEAAFVQLYVSAELFPATMFEGFAEMDAVGAWAAFPFWLVLQ